MEKKRKICSSAEGRKIAAKKEGRVWAFCLGGRLIWVAKGGRGARGGSGGVKKKKGCQLIKGERKARGRGEDEPLGGERLRCVGGRRNVWRIKGAGITEGEEKKGETAGIKGSLQVGGAGLGIVGRE